MTAYTTASPSGAEPRAFVLLKSRRRLDLLDPDPHAWTDDDLAAGLSRTIRWGGASRWEHPLSVAQHSLTVLAFREANGALTPGEALRELLHDATEFMLGRDCITPLKAQLGEPYRALEARLQSAIDARDRLPEWTPEAYAIHKRADRLAAASEAFHVASWSIRSESVGDCRIRGVESLSGYLNMFPRLRFLASHVSSANPAESLLQNIVARDIARSFGRFWKASNAKLASEDWLRFEKTMNATVSASDRALNSSQMVAAV
jgi:hypothetical protein